MCWDCETREEAIAAVRDLRRVNPSAVYELREIMLYLSQRVARDT